MAHRTGAAEAAENCKTNDCDCFEEDLDMMSERALCLVRHAVCDDGLLSLVLADAYAKVRARDFYSGEVFDDIDEAEEIVGERVAGRILDMHPELYSDDFGGDDGEEESDPFDELCGSDICDGCCEECPIACACIPVFVSDGVEMRVVLRRSDPDA